MSFRFTHQQFNAIRSRDNRGLTGYQISITNRDRLISLNEANQFCTQIQQQFINMGQTGRINTSIENDITRTHELPRPLGENIPYQINDIIAYDEHNLNDVFFNFPNRQTIETLTIFIVLED